MLGSNLRVCMHLHRKHNRKVCLGNDFFGDNCLIISVVSLGNSLSIRCIQKLHIQAAIQ